MDLSGRGVVGFGGDAGYKLGQRGRMRLCACKLVAKVDVLISISDASHPDLLEANSPTVVLR